MSEFPWAQDDVDRACRALVAYLDRLRAIEAAARAVLEQGAARYTCIDGVQEWASGPADSYVGDLVPADAMWTLRSAVAGMGGTP